MNPAKSLAVAVLALSTLLPAGQARASDRGGLYAALNIPVSDFAGTGEDGGNADVGVGVGLDINAPINSNLSWSSSVGILFNPQDEPDGLPSDVDLGSWINLPVLTGPRVLTPEGAARGYFQVQGGMALGSQTETSDGYASMNVDWAFSPVLGVGAGTIFERAQLGVRYYHLFEREHEVTLSSPGGGRSGKADITVDVVQLVLGFNF